MVFKHIVIPGGGPHGFTDSGIILYCLKNNIINLKHIESIHGTSAGGIMSVLLCMQNESTIYEDYIVNCMMDKLFYVDPENLVNIFQCKGLINANCFYEYLKPFFDSNNIDVNITLKDFYKITKKHLYLYATRARDLTVAILSNHNFPNMKLLDALGASCAIPGIFPPVVYENELYIDGGIMSNYPLEECLSDDSVIPEEVFGVIHEYPPPEGVIDLNNFNIFDMAFYLVCCTTEKLLVASYNEKCTPEIQEKLTRVHEVIHKVSTYLLTANDLLDIIKSKELRRAGIENGYKLAKDHFANLLKEEKVETIVSEATQVSEAT